MPTPSPSQQVSDAGWIDFPPADVKELLLAALRSATLRAQLDVNELKTIGIALQTDMIGPDAALAWLRDCGLIAQIITPADFEAVQS